MNNPEMLLRIHPTEGGERQLLVSCPNFEVPVRLDRCMSCGKSDGVEIRGRTEAYVRCRALGESHDARRPRTVPISEIMSTDVVSVTADSSIETVIWMLLARGFGGAPVVEGSRGLVGIITSSDLLRHQIGLDAQWGPPTASPEELEFDPREVSIRSFSGLCARDIMTPVVRTLPDDAAVAMAAALMTMERIHRLVVVNHRDPTEVVGIVSSLDVLRWVALEQGYVLGPGA